MDPLCRSSWALGLAVALETSAPEGLDPDAWAEFLAFYFPDVYGEPFPPAKPTKHGPGTEGKIAVLEERAGRGEGLWHPGDAQGQDEQGGPLSAGWPRGRLR